MRLFRLIPKRGFKNPNRVEFAVVNLSALNSTFEDNAEVTLEKLIESGLVKNDKRPVKILARGEITKPMTVQAHHFSSSARDKIEKAGGKAEVI